ncbi:MAG: HAD-IB family phosphatase [Patescibacteria group bacterium]|nr:HAD-IB family phosphatase [Patescibacteria group bacterium]MCL5261846.1 HAD-IB family phosphatase [Patescibacteria group bacterium]
MKIAVFDIDGTLFRSSLAIEFFDTLVEEGLCPVKYLKKYVQAYNNWVNRQASFEEYTAEFITAMDKSLAGLRKKDLIRISKKVADFHQYRIYRYTRDLLLDLQAKKYFTIAISFSPKIIVQEFCKLWHFDEVSGYAVSFDQNDRVVYRGSDELEWDKAKTLKRILKEKRLSLEGSVGVGDTQDDIRFLKMVEHPLCFNPNIKLYKYAKRVGWPVIVERKDVIYNL